MITETLCVERVAQRRGLQFQTQLLKLYFLTTLYVDVKEPAVSYISGEKKLNFVPDSRVTGSSRRRLGAGGSVIVVGTKLSSNLQSQMYVERTP